ncbi:antibiotic biosynthesis monooxygenase [Burkholderia sp. Ac-20384]|uniref:putative quinol monooxygenase n=1 Tax=Burkholderia sp. Ac-20384 TaxID=2703902 RepID=UPI00197D1229|nr:putative quinol monooxygenase [Burkholderia sp. Ac-20384]MBN3827523.1 antibiotic biosynthesis monooxygenase [Burkholderia sp. Ac-20384]
MPRGGEPFIRHRVPLDRDAERRFIFTVAKFIIAVITAEPEHAHTVEQALQAAVPSVRIEPGCIQYDLHRDPSKPGRFVMVEQWRDAQALKVHSNADAFRKLTAILDGRASIEITDLVKIA